MFSNAETSAETGIHVVNLGLRPYRDVWDLQKKLQAELISGAGRDTLILCEHPPTITLGRSTEPDSLLCSAWELKERGVELYDIERGGDATFHGPGQLVGYPIIDLSRHKKDVAWYMRSLEEVVIRTLKDYGIQGVRIDGKTGVWTLSTENDKGNGSRARKIASMGIRISRWCTLHGFSLNVRPCTEGFSLIHPCGFRDISMTSMTEERLFEVDLAEVEKSIVGNFTEVFGYQRR